MQTNLKYLLLSFFLLFSFNALSQKSNEKFVVVLDAGHGGHDPGRPTKFETEKKIALSIVLKIGAKLKKYDNIEVIYTRKKDVFVELHERAAIANKADADLFVSIHCNAWHTGQPYGTETYVLSVGNTDRNMDVAKAENEVIFLEDNHEKNYEGYDPNSPESIIGLTLLQEDYTEQSIILARMVEDNFMYKLKRKSRGVKQISLWVMHNTYMPSVLIETGFLTNKNEGKYISSSKGQEEISQSIHESILEYIETVSNDVDLDVIGEPIEKALSTPSNIVFKVQIAAGARKLETKPYNFNGLKGISSVSIGNGYKYFYGETSNHDEIKKRRDEAIEKGYASAFIVAYKNGELINVSDALKTISN